MIPGRSSSCMLAPLYSMTPGMQVSVVNSYEAATLWVLVRVLSKVLCGGGGGKERVKIGCCLFDFVLMMWKGVEMMMMGVRMCCFFLLYRV